MKQHTDPVKAYLSKIGRAGGLRKTEAQKAASRANGAKSKGPPKGNQNWKGRIKAEEKASDD